MIQKVRFLRFWGFDGGTLVLNWPLIDPCCFATQFRLPKKYQILRFEVKV